MEAINQDFSSILFVSGLETILVEEVNGELVVKRMHLRQQRTGLRIFC